MRQAGVPPESPVCGGSSYKLTGGVNSSWSLTLNKAGGYEEEGHVYHLAPPPLSLHLGLIYRALISIMRFRQGSHCFSNHIFRDFLRTFQDFSGSYLPFLRVIFRENQTWSGMCDVTDFNELWGYQSTIGRYFDCKFFSSSDQW